MSTTGKPIHVNSDNFETEVVNSDIPVVVDFWAPWCGPCRMIAPVLDELSAEYDGQVKVAKVNVDEEQDLASQYFVRGIPTLVVVKDGATQEQVVGFRGAQSIQDLFAGLSRSSVVNTAQVSQ